MRTKVLCPDCGHKNYSVNSFCQRCSGKLGESKVKLNKLAIINLHESGLLSRFINQ